MVAEKLGLENQMKRAPTAGNFGLCLVHIFGDGRKVFISLGFGILFNPAMAFTNCKFFGCLIY